MARPALSAARAIDVLDLFAAFPGRSFTMSEITRATGINTASCHAVLAVLVARGYLERRQREYRLGRPIVALGQAAEQVNPLVKRAQAGAQALNSELGVAVLLSTLAGDEILALSSLRDKEGRSPGLQQGQRIRMVPPNGVHFIAWAAKEQIDEWISRSQSSDEDEIARWRETIALTRKRGYQVTLQREQTPEFSEMMARLAEGSPPLAHRQKAGLVADHGWILEQPDSIKAEVEYSVALIAAPIFDDIGGGVLSLSLGGFSSPLSGMSIAKMAEKLLRTCFEIMGDGRIV